MNGLLESEFRRKLIDAFPPLRFNGLVSKHDECDDGVHVRENLAGKRWDELSPEVLFHGSIGLPLLEPPALIAFLPAWILRSVETSNLRDPIVLEFTLYFLCPGDEEDGWDERRIADRVAHFNSAQRAVVSEFLRFVVSTPTGGYWEKRAAFGLTWWEPAQK
jgi:hypothetical protein